MGEQLHAADAVGDRVVHLHRERGAFAVGAVESFEERELPQRAGAVEARGRDRLQRVEQRAHRSGPGQPDAPQVEVEIEGRLGRPARRCDAERRRHDPLAQSRDEARRAVDAPPQPLPVGDRVEERDREDRRAQDGSFSMFHMSASSSLMCCANVPLPPSMEGTRDIARRHRASLSHNWCGSSDARSRVRACAAAT